MRHKYRRYFLYYAGRLAAFLMYLLPLRVGASIGALIGRCAFLVLAKYRKITIDNLTGVFGAEKSAAEIKIIARKVFENLGRFACELVNLPKINRDNIDRFLKIEGLDNIDRSFERGKGTIVLTAHFGNWELVGLAFLVHGYPGTTIVRKIYFHKYNDFLSSLRRTYGLNATYRDESARKMLGVLKENKILGIVADQDVDSVDGVFVNFFGRRTYTPSGPAVLARVSKAAMVPVFMVREGSGFVMKIERPVELVDTGNKEADLVTNTQKWSDVVESYIRRYPDQWVWMHRRWKTQGSK